MTIKSFIQSQLLSRLQTAGVLVVYDPARRYRELCLELAADKRQVIDASESSLASRLAALKALQIIGTPGSKIESLLIYIPAPAPLTDEEKQVDPFAIYGASGAIFPASDGDEYASLCLKHKPDHATDLRRIFTDNPNPSFAVIDAVGGGSGWPHLQAALGVVSARELLFALLTPSDSQKTALKAQEAWVGEAKTLFANALGLRLVTKAKTWSPVADELWRCLLFSEFVFDLPEPLPEALADVPHALPEARPVVDDLCEWLRNDRRTQAAYLDRAESIEQELNLATSCQLITDLGVRDTFPFEERSFFAQAVEAFQRDNLDKLHTIVRHRQNSIWMGRGEHQAQWRLLEAAADLSAACAEAEDRLPEPARSQAALIDFYVSTLRDVDRLQRELAQAAEDQLLSDPVLQPVLHQARAAYQRLSSRVQDAFLRHLEKSGWPPAGRLANAAVFDQLIAPKLQESGRRVAVILIDALRYELGVELAKQLTEEGQVDTQAAYAPLPSITRVGMAALLPGAGTHLTLTRKDDSLVPVLGDQPVTNITQRLDVLRKRYGQRFADYKLDDFVKTPPSLPTSVELLLLRSNEMDENFEHNPDTALTLITRTFQQVRRALNQLAGQGYTEAFLLTDHGFYLNTALGAGDVCAKPPGNWINVHERCLLGDGAADSNNVVVSADLVGVRGDFKQLAFPRALVVYRAGQTYFHGGASLQELVVPVINIRLRAAQLQTIQPAKVTLFYKRGAKKITTRLPVLELEIGGGDLFSPATFDVLLQAQDKKGNVVGEPKPGGPVNPATLTLAVKPGGTLQITFKMNEDFEGKFTVKAFDPATSTTLAKLELETDYTV